MSDQSVDPVFHIRRVYLKDLSVEQPNSPSIFLETESPSFEFAFDVSQEQLAEGFFESIVIVAMTAKIEEKIAFHIEAKQAGIFELYNFSEDQTNLLLGIGCPNILFPYLRANIADAITRAGFQPVHLSEINFEAYYQQRHEAQAQTERRQRPYGDSGLLVPAQGSATSS